MVVNSVKKRRMSGLLREGAIKPRQHFGQAFRVGQQGETAASENAGKPVLSIFVDDDGVQGLARLARLTNGHVAVFDPVLAFVMVQIIRAAVGQDDQQLPGAWLIGKLCAHMAKRSSAASIPPARAAPASRATSITGVAPMAVSVDLAGSIRNPTERSRSVCRAACQSRSDPRPVPDKPEPFFTDPAPPWASAYLTEGSKPRALKAQSSFSTSPEGIADLDGSVWEWTMECYDGSVEVSDTLRCPAFFVGGEHIAAISYLIRDPVLWVCGRLAAGVFGHASWCGTLLPFMMMPHFQDTISGPLTHQT